MYSVGAAGKSGSNNLLKAVNQMGACFGCGGSIDVFDR
jgi:hypothetical protein